MTAANDLGLTTSVPARLTIYPDTYPRTIEIEANAGDPSAAKPVVYTLDFKRIAAKTAYWAGRPAMRIVQALNWFRDDRSTLEPAVSGIVRHLSKSSHRQAILQDLQENINALPAWMYAVVKDIVAELSFADGNGKEWAGIGNPLCIHPFLRFFALLLMNSERSFSSADAGLETRPKCRKRSLCLLGARFPLQSAAGRCDAPLFQRRHEPEQGVWTDPTLLRRHRYRHLRDRSPSSTRSRDCVRDAVTEGLGRKGR
jgi:hypothetical protein